jgi:hypothetical protein
MLEGTEDTATLWETIRLQGCQSNVTQPESSLYAFASCRDRESESLLPALTELLGHIWKEQPNTGRLACGAARIQETVLTYGHDPSKC